MFVLSISAYIFIPFLYIYGAAILLSIVAVLIDISQPDPKQGVIFNILKWTVLIPVINLIPILFIPVFSFVNLFFKDEK